MAILVNDTGRAEDRGIGSFTNGVDERGRNHKQIERMAVEGRKGTVVHVGVDFYGKEGKGGKQVSEGFSLYLHPEAAVELANALINSVPAHLLTENLERGSLYATCKAVAKWGDDARADKAAEEMEAAVNRGEAHPKESRE